MYRDWDYFKREAEAIVDQQGVRYNRSTSGYDKGQYSARLDLEKVGYEEQNKYLTENYGSAIPTYNRYGSSISKDDAKKYLVSTIAIHLQEIDEQKNTQKASERWDYYKSLSPEQKKDTYLKGKLGYNLHDYFKLLSGETNEDNWQIIAKSIRGSINSVTSFKEFFYYLKQRALEEFLKNNKEGKDGYGNNIKPRNTFVFDSENIPEEQSLELKLNPIAVTQDEKVEDIPVETIGIHELSHIAITDISNDGFTKVGYRASFLNGNVLVGRRRDIIFPNNEQHQSYFAIVNMDDIIASHNEQTFSTTQNYPVDSDGRNINDRNYAGDKNAQAKVKTVAQKLNPNIIISTSATASGTPVITIDGVVISGNNRTMSLKLSNTEGYKEHFEKYQKILQQEIAIGGYGFPVNTANALRLNKPITTSDGKNLKFETPILVRIDVAFPGYNTSELNKFNKSRNKSEKNIDTAIRISRQLQESGNDRCKTSLIDLVSEQEVVSELYSNKEAVNRFKRILLDCNIITENEISGNFTDVSLTENGKILFDTLLLSLVLDAKAIEISQNDGVKSATRSIVNAIIPLIKNSKLGEFSLIEEVNNALLIQNSMISHSYKTLGEYITQMTMFNDDDVFKTFKGFVLNSFMNEKVNSLKTALLKYNNSAESNTGIGLFGDNLTPEQVFDAIFIKEADATVIKALQIKTGAEPEKIIEEVEKTEVAIPIQAPSEPNDQKASLQLRIKRLQSTLKYQTEEDKPKVEQLINRLIKATKYL